MTKNSHIISEDQFFFHQCIIGTKKIVQDTIYHVRRIKKNKNVFLDKHIREMDAHSYYFLSHQCKAIISNNPICYMKNIFYQKELKELRMGKYYPDIFLDLHGFTQYAARKELGKLITICHVNKFLCACVIHGHGKNILKQQIPIWLSKHPDVIAFHKSPKIFGGDAALLVLIEKNI